MADGPMHCVCVTTTKAAEPLLLETNHNVFRQMGEEKKKKLKEECATLIMHFTLVQFVSIFLKKLHCIVRLNILVRIKLNNDLF